MQYLIDTVATTHNLSVDEKRNLSTYFVYLQTGVPRAVNILAFYYKLIESKEFTLKFVECETVVFEISETSKNMNLTEAPSCEMVWDTTRLFCNILAVQSRVLGKEMTSFYLSNYTGYGLGSKNLKGMHASLRKHYRLAGMFRRLNSLPSDGFWALRTLLNEGKLPTVEDMY